MNLEYIQDMKEKRKKLVSCIVPFYNNVDTLKECVESLSPDNKILEFILVDDCSTDGSDKVAEELALKYPTVIYTKLLGKGYEAGARQVGLCMATGEITLQCDADARYPEGYIPEMLKELIKGAYFSDDNIIGVEQGSIIPIGDKKYPAVRYNMYKRFASKELKLQGKKKPYGGTMYYTKARDYAHYKPLKIGTDTEFVKELKSKGLTFAYNKDTFFYHHDPKTWGDHFKRMRFYYENVQNKPSDYKWKILIKGLFPLIAVLYGERPMQYKLAMKNKDIHGIFSIFAGNFLTDIAGIFYWKRYIWKS